MAPFYGWGSTASRLEPLRGGSLLFTTKFPEIPGTQRSLHTKNQAHTTTTDLIGLKGLRRPAQANQKMIQVHLTQVKKKEKRR